MPVVYRPMARKPRLHIPGAFHHVILRGNDKQRIFFTANDRFHLFDLIGEGTARFDHRVHAYCLMSNHVHLLIETGTIPLSNVVQNFAFRYTQHINRTRSRTGHLFQGRFKSFLVDADSYLMELVRYIHLNPVRANLAQTAGSYRWSSHGAYSGKISISWLTTGFVLSMFSERESVARRKYQDFVDQRSASLFVPSHVDADNNIVRTEIEELPPKQCQSLGIPLSTTLDLAQIVENTCTAFELDTETLRAISRGSAARDARETIIFLASRFNAGSMRDIGERLSRRESSVHLAKRQAELRINSDAAFARRVAEIERSLSHQADTSGGQTPDPARKTEA